MIKGGLIRRLTEITHGEKLARVCRNRCEYVLHLALT